MGCAICGRIFGLKRWMQLTWLGERLVKGVRRFFRRCSCDAEISATQASLESAEAATR